MWPLLFQEEYSYLDSCSVWAHLAFLQFPGTTYWNPGSVPLQRHVLFLLRNVDGSCSHKFCLSLRLRLQVFFNKILVPTFRHDWCDYIKLTPWLRWIFLFLFLAFVGLCSICTGYLCAMNKISQTMERKIQRDFEIENVKDIGYTMLRFFVSVFPLSKKNSPGSWRSRLYQRNFSHKHSYNHCDLFHANNYLL